jgi:hypothetical protein
VLTIEETHRAVLLVCPQRITLHAYFYSDAGNAADRAESITGSRSIEVVYWTIDKFKQGKRQCLYLGI